MRNLFGYLALGLVCVGGIACAAVDEPSDEAPDGEEAVAEDDLVTGRVKSIKVNRSAGFGPPMVQGQCRRAGAWTYSFETKALTGNACLEGASVTVDKVLSEADHVRVRTALSKVRTTKKPAACPTDMPVASLEVSRAKSTLNYVDARASCGGSRTPVKEATLDGLVTLLEELSATPANDAPCVRSGCSGQICADQAMFSTCVWRPEYACYQAATCERGADGQCGFRQTPELASCLANAGGSQR